MKSTDYSPKVLSYIQALRAANPGEVSRGPGKAWPRHLIYTVPACVLVPLGALLSSLDIPLSQNFGSLAWAYAFGFILMVGGASFLMTSTSNSQYKADDLDDLAKLDAHLFIRASGKVSVHDEDQITLRFYGPLLAMIFASAFAGWLWTVFFLFVVMIIVAVGDNDIRQLASKRVAEIDAGKRVPTL